MATGLAGIPYSYSKPFPMVYNRLDGLPIVWPCVGLLLAPRKVWIGRNQRDGCSLNEDALLSRLRAACADADGVKGSMKDDTVKLARKLNG